MINSLFTVSRALAFIVSCLLVTSLFSQNETIYALQVRNNPLVKEVKFDIHSCPRFVTFKKNQWIDNQTLCQVLGLSKSLTLKETQRVKDQIGQEHIRYTQTYNDLKILGAEYILHNSASQSLSANGKIIHDLDLKTQPTLSTEQALEFALAFVKAKAYMWENEANEQFLRREQQNASASFYPKGELVISRAGYDKTSAWKLAYLFDIYASQPIGRYNVEVDAHTGAILNYYSKIHTAHTEGTGETLYDGTVNINIDHDDTLYYLADKTRGGGIYTYDYKKANSPIDFENASLISEPDSHFNEESSRAGVSVHFGIMTSYDYFFNNFDLNSFNGEGATVHSYVNYNATISGGSNASWDGSRLRFGSGDGEKTTAWVSLDIVGHEFTHAVTEYSSELVYLSEPGALNESFSDIFGQVVELNTFPKTENWNIGDQVFIDGTSMIRSMSDPKSQNQPDTYKGEYWIKTSDFNNDNGGIHTNSGVQNHWFYLLVKGGSGVNDNGYAYNVPSIGLEAAANIAYRNLTVYLYSNAFYAEARMGSELAAIDLYGKDSQEHLAVSKAWDAVGVSQVDPEVSVTESIQFGEVPVGIEVSKTLSVSNNERGIVRVYNIEVANDDFAFSQRSFVIGQFKSQDIQVSFKPTDASNRSTTAKLLTSVGEISVKFTASGVEPPLIHTSPNPLLLTLPKGETVKKALTIANTKGGSLLNWNAYLRHLVNESTEVPQNANTESKRKNTNKKKRILAWTLHADMEVEYRNIKQILTQMDQEITIVETRSSDKSEFRDLLQDADIFLIPKQTVSDEDFSFYSELGATFSDLLHDFVESGGGIIMFGNPSYGAHPFLNSSQLLLNKGVDFTSPNISLKVSDPSHHLLSNVPSSINSQPYTYSLILNDPNAQQLISYEDKAVVALKDIGYGGIIYLAYTYKNYDSGTAQLIKNSINYFDNRLQWFSLETREGSVSSEASLDLNVTFNSQGLMEGVYKAEIVLYTNDPQQTEVTIPVEMTVIVEEEGDDDEIPLVSLSGKALRIFPNPSPGTKVVIENKSAISLLEIMDSTGKVIFRTDSVGGARIEIRVNDFRPGMYLMTVADHKGITRRRLIIR